MMKIFNRFTKELLGEYNISPGANLYKANLSEADLHGADLREIYLGGADLRKADLSKADLREANLRRTNLCEANLREADLRAANLRKTNMSGADLSKADLRYARLSGIDLRGTKYSVLSILQANWGEVSDILTTEMMKWDAACCPNLDAFQDWAQGGDCPCRTVQRAFLFEEHRELYEAGSPTMSLWTLWEALAREREIKI